VIIGERYANGACLGATSTQGAGIGEIGIDINPPEKRREYIAHGSGVYRAVGMPAHRSVNRADVETGSTVKAVEHLTEPFSDQSRATVIEKDHMEFLGSLLFSLFLRTGYKRNITRYGLTGCRTGE
jgi:hypothetical protein